MSAPSLAKRLRNKAKLLLEGPPVRERTVVRVVDSRAQERLPPAFLVGTYRSGSTLLRFILDSHSHIAVPPESNFLLSLRGLREDPWMKKGLAAVGVDDEAMMERLRGFAWSIFDDYTRAKEKQRWIDKTPGYIDILPFLQALFGDRCRFIMLYRHGLDVANSMAEGVDKNVVYGPAVRYITEAEPRPRVGFAHYWSDQCEKMLAFENAFPQQCHRIRYEDYATDPERFLPPLFERLGEPWEPEVLQFNKQSHDVGLQDHKAADSHRFDPAIGNYHRWTEEETKAALEHAGAMLERLDYRV